MMQLHHKFHARSLHMYPIRQIFSWLLFIGIVSSSNLTASSQEDLPVAYQGRFRSIKAYAALQSLTLDELWEKHNHEKPSPLEEAYQHRLNELKSTKRSSKEIGTLLEIEYPLQERVQKSGHALLILPGRYPSGDWFSPHAFATRVYDPLSGELKEVGNFTAFDDTTFHALRSLYASKKQKEFIDAAYKAYSTLAGQIYAQAHLKSLAYPSLNQLRIETHYVKYPWVSILLMLYVLALLFYLLPYKRTAFALVLSAFLLHTSILLARCFILNRPPVSNMYETVLYVPWVAMAIALFFYFLKGSRLPLACACLAAAALIGASKWIGLQDDLNPVQAVLDSQYWLIIHVMMVVGSYGLFILAGVLGHLYLGYFLIRGQQSINHLWMVRVADLILQNMYLGTGLLIGGTILGGVWAAESWGRFWDWDPKEAWAFITICNYLLWIHAYRFGKIAHFGLAVGSVLGLLSVSFTWYGVNYILGTGLHSYGFGTGGEFIYYTYVLAELIFLGAAAVRRKALRNCS